MIRSIYLIASSVLVDGWRQPGYHLMSQMLINLLLPVCIDTWVDIWGGGGGILWRAVQI